MNRRLNKLIFSCLMVATLTYTSVTAQAEETVDMEYADTEYTDSLCIGSCAANIKSIYKAKYPEQAEVIDDIVDTLSSSDQFVAIFNEEGASAFCIIEDSLRDVLEPTVEPCMYTDELYTTKYLVPAVRQSDHNNCGPASTLMALIGSGASGYSYTTDSNTLNTWQNILKGRLRPNNESVTNIGDITAVMRENVPSRNGYIYKTKAFSKYTYNKALGYIESSLIMDAVPVILVKDTSLLGYYNGHSCSHYMVVTSVDILAEEITVIDPHYDDKYFGVHYISFTEFVNMAEKCKDLFISTYTTDSSNDAYIYN